ncbi:linear amide C-N hydrolase [Pusillimonas noertemannii]|uniref:Penicillin amidase n=1 Tax=Pusillimonas noertemannii TaxID=305977 RepID=A0A2U1CPN3_9BURK|nr:choloylglycine hydrolase family protein [Pusillimonas noertemannii]NYT67168.1 choloylglycine hydrolase family protein [Pusillimonas noertemannii]PVY67845.1 penicillin amidase [Pusillimonas noertemannii]TFL12630.1 choloylglycine hydrolase family protein [Pusillimonas noertemannii]
MPRIAPSLTFSWRPAARKTAAAVLAATLLAPQWASACTSFLIRSTDGGAVYGRTMEFGFELESRAMVIPRAYKLSSTGPDGKPAMSWTGKYAAVGLNALGLTALVDGMNEKGLAGGVLYFPGYAGYADPAKADPAKSLAPWDFLTWALTNHATVAEVKAALSDVAVINVIQEALKIAPPLHYTLHDATGASLVIEPIDGKLKVYDNPLGVMTNSPSFDWHLTNLSNYVKLSSVNAPPLKVGGVTIPPLGQGSGLLGIPGDGTPPSRFVRALGYTLSAEPVASGPQSVRLAEHIVNNFDIPKGWVRDKDQGSEPLEYTQWSSVADLSNRSYYVKTYDDPVLRGIDLKTVDLDAKEVLSIELKPQLTPPSLLAAKP